MSALSGIQTAVTMPAESHVNRRRALLVLGTAAGVGIAVGLGPGSAASGTDPGLVRLLQFMALLKGLFALVAFAACAWRLARPATLWREAIYVTGPGVMAAGAVCLWQLQSAGIAALTLHAGMFALLAAALTDETFIPALKRRPG